LNYTQGIAAMALCEAAGMGGSSEVKIAAQKAVEAIDDAQRRTDDSQREAWDYWPQSEKAIAGQNDSSVMAWNVLALKSARIAGLKVNVFCFEGTMRWIDAAQNLKDFNPNDAAAAYDYLGGFMPYRGTCAQFGGQGSFATMAAAGLCRLMIGGAAADHPGVLGPCNRIKKANLPTGYPFNLYYGYYASLLMFQKGGDHWTAWNEAMKPALINGQLRGGKDDGSWDYPEASKCESRVMSTALAVLCLEVYYRFQKLNN